MVVPPRFLYPAIDGNTVTIFTIFNIAVACCVLVVEMRVRKKEISRGLSQLDSKRAFVRCVSIPPHFFSVGRAECHSAEFVLHCIVRYISHEMRTPLSAAAMGLSLLEDDLALEDELDVQLEGSFLERHGDVLRMVQDSFKKAEAICSDLLQYDKVNTPAVTTRKDPFISPFTHRPLCFLGPLHQYEDDNLPIYTQTYRAAELLQDMVDPFHVLARRAGVELKVNVYTNRHVSLAGVLSGRDEYVGSTPVLRKRNREADADLLNALIDADKPKLTQVLSNLLSNAFKFTPQNGKVIMTVYLSDVLGIKAMDVVPWDNVRIAAAVGAASEKGNVRLQKKASNLTAVTDVNVPRLSISHLRRHNESVDVTSRKGSVGELLKIKSEKAPSSGGGRSWREGDARVYGSDNGGDDNNDNNNNSVAGADAALSEGGPRSARGDHHAALPTAPGPLRSKTPRTARGAVRKFLLSAKHRRKLLDNVKARLWYFMFGDLDREIDQRLLKQPSERSGSSESDDVGQEAAAAAVRYLVVSVTDSGVGIAPEDIPKMFRSIVQFNPNELQGGGGSGLGMVLSRGIVERHAGKMWLHSEGVGHGSTFAFGIPLSKVEEPTADPKTGAPIEKSQKAPSDPREPSVRIDPRSERSSIRTVERRVSFGAFDGDVLIDCDNNNLALPTAKSEGGGGGLFVSFVEAARTATTAQNKVYIAPDDAVDGARPLRKEKSFSATVAQPDAPSREARLAQGGPRKRALIAEDDEVCRLMTAKVLESLGYEVDEAEDGAEAVTLMRAALLAGNNGGRPIDLVVSDWVMPKMDGPTAVAKMREDGYHGPIFGVTGNALETDIAHFLAKGADRILTKPLKVPELKKALQEYDKKHLPPLAATWPSARERKETEPADTAAAAGGDAGAALDVSTITTTHTTSTTMRPSSLRPTDSATVAPPTVSPSVKASSTTTSVADVGASKRVLVAEDDAVCRKMLARVLKSLKYEVEEAEDGAIALATMQAAVTGEGGKLPFDLVLSDYTMPNMDGPESVAGMRACGYTGPIFGVTGNQLQSDIDHFTAKGADKVIAKPLKLPDLKKAIQEYDVENQQVARARKDTEPAAAADGGGGAAGTSAGAALDVSTTNTTSTTMRPSSLCPTDSATVAPPTVSPSVKASSTTTSVADVGASKRVLVAEDDAVCRKMLARVLKSLKYEVEEAEDGAIALATMQAAVTGEGGKLPFDLVLSDYTMPNMDGPESVAGMRACGYTGPIFGVTGNQLQSDIDHFTAKGADKVIAKPLKLPDLKKAIQEYDEQKGKNTNVMSQNSSIV